MDKRNVIFPNQFISASADYADYNNQVPAPYIRKVFPLTELPKAAELLITGLGFYRVFINGTELTKSILAPYISNPDDFIYYDSYNSLPYLKEGNNVLGIILGNGMQNAYGGFVWNFDNAAWRGAPMTALRLDMEPFEGELVSIESDVTFLTHPSPLLEDDLRSGDVYDARRSIDDWCLASYSDKEWNPVIRVLPPRGEKRICTASPIKAYERRKAISIIPYQEGFLYDFGVNTAGVCELFVQGEKGQCIDISYAEWYHDGILEKENLMFPNYDFPHIEKVQNSRYICRGDDKDHYMSYFTYYGFRYAYVKGITKEQATENLLVYHVMSGDFKEVGHFSCSDDTANTLQEMTRRSVLSNFLWIPTDCPHREKNGWTGDAALSAEHMLMNLTVDDSLHEWLRNVAAAQAFDGGFPGIVPTGDWGFGTGPAWDQVIVEIPYCLFRLRGDLSAAREVAPFIFRYLFHLSGLRNEHGLVDVGLGDWCETGKSGGGHKAPISVTSTAISVSLLEKSMILFHHLGMEDERAYADNLRSALKKSFRKYLIDFSTMTVSGSCQASQAMAIYYGLFQKSEIATAFSRLMSIIHQNNDHINAGALGLRVLFHVLSNHGESDLAFQMITRKDYPSYGNWIVRGATALWEDFLPVGGAVNSQNHHFFGDISSWFIQKIAGIVPNPYAEDVDIIRVAPNFIKSLNHAEASYHPPSGKITVAWGKKKKESNNSIDIVQIDITVAGLLHGTICLPLGWEFDDGFCEKELLTGTYTCKDMQ